MADYSGYYGGFSVLFIMILVFAPFNNEVQGWTSNPNATAFSNTVAVVFPYAYLLLTIGLAIALFVSMARKLK